MDRHLASAPRSRPALGIVVLAACATAIVLLAQCRRVGDNITGVDLTVVTANGRSKCVHRCTKQYIAARRVENQRHQKAVVGCHGDAACLDTERTLHQNNERQIAEGFKQCRRNCYNEGGGRGGR